MKKRKTRRHARINRDIAAAKDADGLLNSTQNPPITTSGSTATPTADDQNSPGGNTVTDPVIPKPSDPRVRGSVLGPPILNRKKPTVRMETPPTPDGMLIVRSITGGLHEYPYADMAKGWRVYNRYLSVSTATGWVNWPWESILMWETIHNSEAYRSARSNEEEKEQWQSLRR